MTRTPNEIVAEVIRILMLPGDEVTDGECLDMIADMLESEGHEVFRDRETRA